MANFRWSDLAKYAEKQNMRLEQITRRSILEVSRNVILKTPVDTGRARNNWQASIDRPATGEVSGTDKSGGRAIAKAGGQVGESIGKVYYLVNNVPYIRRLEYEGWSQQAPNGMVRTSVKEMNQILKSAIKSTK